MRAISAKSLAVPVILGLIALCVSSEPAAAG